MDPAGFYEIKSGQRGQPGVPPITYRARLGWFEGVPYIIDRESSASILVNGEPLEPNIPFVLRPGDRITIADLDLTWHAPGQVADVQPEAAAIQPEEQSPPDPRATIALPRHPAESSPARPAPPARSPVPPEDRTPDKTLVVPKRPPGWVKVETTRPATPEPPESAETPGAPAEATQATPKKGGGKPAKSQAADETIIVPKDVIQQLRAESGEATILATSKPPKSPSATPQSDVADLPEVGEQPVADETAWVDMAQLAGEDLDLDYMASTIIRDTQIPRLVVHLPSRTWEVPLVQGKLTVGRSDDSDIVISDQSVSRHHAAIEPRGSVFVIRDTGSKTGLWVGTQRIEEHALQTGDIVSLGRAKLVFKGGFTSNDLTLIQPPRIDGKRMRRPVVVVPGLMGSELWLGSERLWPDPGTMLSNPEVYSLPGDPRIEARNIVSDVVIVPGIIKLRQYSGLGDYLVEGLGYTRDKDLFEFAYDWRQDVRMSALRLGEAIERWQLDTPPTIIAHSLGTLVTRYYVERLGGKEAVERIILMGGPHYGTPKGLAAILVGPGMLPFGMGAERMRHVLATFPSAYQILPIYPCIFDQNENHIDALKDRSWLPEKQRPFLGAAQSFRRELGEQSSVPTVSVFGYGLKTILRVRINRRSDGQWDQIEFLEDTAGDASVPSGSAVLKDSEIHPVLQEHGSLYMDDDVRMRLKVELTRSTIWQRR
jgi:predicted component of type VI protein secretion system/pimeloyl-ACP methyl ester carboxylesterase